MKGFILFILLSSLVFGDQASTRSLAKIRLGMEKLVREERMAGATVLALKDGGIFYQSQVGFRDRDGDRVMEKGTIFRIYSMTKALTSVLALQLVEEGRLGLDETVGAYLPAFRNQKVWTESGLVPVKREATIRDLLRHTAGLGPGPEGTELARRYQGILNQRKGLSLSELVSQLGELPLLYQPGTRWVYGVSTDVLAAVVEKAAGEPFHDVMRKRLLSPLEMNDTGYSVPEEKRERLAGRYRREEGSLGVVDPAEGTCILSDPIFKGGGSGLVSTEKDYMSFLQMIAGDGEYEGVRYLKRESVDLMRTNQLPKEIPAISFGDEKRHGTGFGLGFSVRISADPRWDAQAPVGEYGWGGAASTHYWLSPRHGLIVLTMEQTFPYSWDMERLVKPLLYEAIE